MPGVRSRVRRALLLLPCLAGAAAVLGAVGLAARLRYARRRTANTSGTQPGIRTSDGILLSTESSGPEHAPVTIVFAHGFAASSEEFMYQRQALAHEARVVLFDQRGHGRSGWGDHRAATLEQLGNDLGWVIDQQPGDCRIVLAAHSMGGMAALALAGKRPELFGDRIAAVALLSTAGGHLARMEIPGEIGRLAARSGAATAAANVLWLAAPVIDWIAPFRRRWGRRWLLGRLFGGDDPPEHAAAVMLRMWRRTPLAMVTAFYPALAHFDKTNDLAALRSIPVLVLSGSKDRAIPCDRSRKLADELGENAHLVLVEGAGHMVNLTHPDVVNRALRDLLERAGL